MISLFELLKAAEFFLAGQTGEQPLLESLFTASRISTACTIMEMSGTSHGFEELDSSH